MVCWWWLIFWYGIHLLGYLSSCLTNDRHLSEWMRFWSSMWSFLSRKAKVEHSTDDPIIWESTGSANSLYTDSNPRLSDVSKGSICSLQRGANQEFGCWVDTEIGVTSRIGLFLWKVAWDCLLTRECLRGHGMDILLIRPSCDGVVETVSYVIF